MSFDFGYQRIDSATTIVVIVVMTHQHTFINFGIAINLVRKLVIVDEQHTLLDCIISMIARKLVDLAQKDVLAAAGCSALQNSAFN